MDSPTLGPGTRASFLRTSLSAFDPIGMRGVVSLLAFDPTVMYRYAANIQLALFDCADGSASQAQAHTPCALSIEIELFL